MVYVVLGVAGSGKSTISELLSEHLHLPYFDADDFHPQSNIDKMSGGTPLNDFDRYPWLESLAKHIKDWNSDKGAVLACSGLKKIYRDQLCSYSSSVQFIYPKISKEEILKRLEKRENHFFKPEMLDSQFETLEEPSLEEAWHIDGSKDPQNVLQQILLMKE